MSNTDHDSIDPQSEAVIHGAVDLPRPFEWYRWGFYLLAVVAVSMIAIAVFPKSSDDTPHATQAIRAVESLRLATLDQIGQSHVRGWCGGDETICATVTTTKPAETLQALITALPQAEARHYTIHLSIEETNAFEDLPEHQVDQDPVTKILPTLSTGGAREK
ncbi:hypothetical protein [Pseudomonas sp. UMAB-40]|uniref:hypothetical protein n=1 Tax=Pseudomonas sp. UMAB-40 TaxID=1365407 RepID=UPI001C59BC4E|nr:hypothetical protein [Pseudomonas sp. UMAB-40]